MRKWFLALGLWLMPAAAQAEWFEASSTNFVVYADDSERDVRRFSERLELYHEAMEGLTGLDLPAPSPSNRLTVFVVSSPREVQRIYGEGARHIGGFYVPRAGGSIAIVPQVQLQRGQLDQSMLVLLHEYAHHFLTSNSSVISPRWYNEGGAEFFASAEFPTAGGIKIGLPAHHRAGELLYAREVTIEQLLDPAAYQDGARKGFDSFYGKSWLLYHYLALGPEERRGQLRRYLQLMSSGKGSREAGVEAFGNFEQLDRELDRYVRQRILTAVFAPGQLQVPAITVRRLTTGEAAILPVVIRSRRGVDSEIAERLVQEARTIAAAHPDDPAVLAALAETEFDAGDDVKAIAAADAALAIDPNRVNAYVQKGYALFRQALGAEDRTVAYRAAVEPFVALNKLENDHPLPLIYYFRSYAERGARPPEQAVRGLERATELAPFDLGLRFNLAAYQIQAGDLAGARGSLVPVAYNPHGGPMADSARLVVERIDAGGESAAPELMNLLRGAPPEAAGGAQ
jgi:tetratricopeptide (TPR) repeat protein